MTWPVAVRGLYLAAMAVFLVTIGIGIINGLDLYTFDRNQLLTHVHTGTLGWITLSLVATSAWLARGIDTRLAWSLGLIIPIYALGFLVDPAIRSVLGTVLLLAILWLVVWAWRAYAALRSLPALAVALGFTTFTYGAIIGVLRQVQLAGGPTPFPTSADIVGAHASAMVFSYLILVAMGLLEWRILGTRGLPSAGLVQFGALFAGGLILSGTLLFLNGNAVQAAGGLDLLVDLVAVGIFAWRVARKALSTNWTAGAGRHLAASSGFVIMAMAIFLYVIVRFIGDPSLATDPTPIAGILTASDHAAFIGVVTNLVFAQLLTLSGDQRAGGSFADQVAFWGVNLGLATFLVGLIADLTILKEIGAPVMGVCLLVGLAAFAARLRSSNLGAATA